MLLSSFNQHAFGGGAVNCQGDSVQFFLEHDSENFTHIVNLGKDLRFWEHSESGQFDFASSNSPDFAEFAQLVTDGHNDFIVTLGYVFACGGGGPGYQEADVLGGDPDLSGTRLEFVRLIVADLTLEPQEHPCNCGTSIHYDANLIWEFWGTPVPEPAAIVLLTVGLLFLSRRSPRNF
jgi:hypothetical protein